MSNRKEGTTFEQEFCKILGENQFWVHNIAQNQTGQPADIIAVKNDVPYLIDCKVCANDKFLFSRVEENQAGAMTLWKVRGNKNCFFALKDSHGHIYMLEYGILREFQLIYGQRGIYDISKLQTLDEWLEVTK